MSRAQPREARPAAFINHAYLVALLARPPSEPAKCRAGVRGPRRARAPRGESCVRNAAERPGFAPPWLHPCLPARGPTQRLTQHTWDPPARGKAASRPPQGRGEERGLPAPAGPSCQRRRQGAGPLGGPLVRGLDYVSKSHSWSSVRGAVTRRQERLLRYRKGRLRPESKLGGAGGA